VLLENMGLSISVIDDETGNEYLVPLDDLPRGITIPLRDPDGNLIVRALVSEEGRDVEVNPGYQDDSHTGRRCFIVNFGRIQASGAGAGRSTAVVFKHPEKSVFMDWQLYGEAGGFTGADHGLALIQSFANVYVTERITSSCGYRITESLGPPIYIDLKSGARLFVRTFDDEDLATTQLEISDEGGVEILGQLGLRLSEIPLESVLESLPPAGRQAIFCDTSNEGKLTRVTSDGEVIVIG